MEDQMGWGPWLTEEDDEEQPKLKEARRVNEARRNSVYAETEYEAFKFEALKGRLIVEVEYDVTYDQVPWAKHRSEIVAVYSLAEAHQWLEYAWRQLSPPLDDRLGWGPWPGEDGAEPISQENASKAHIAKVVNEVEKSYEHDGEEVVKIK